MRHWIILALLCIVAPPLHAEDVSKAAPINLQQVILNVLERNPQFSINDYEARAAAARINQAIQVTPLSVKLEIENLVGTGEYSGIDRLETTLSLAKVLELGNKASARGDLSQQQAKLIQNEQDSKRLDLLAKAAEQFMHVVVDQHRLRIAHEQMKLLEHTHEIVARRVKAGRSHIAEQRRIAITMARMEIELEHAEHELATSRVKLSASWGETEQNFGKAEANLFELPPIPPFKQLEILLENNPDLIRFVSEERVTRSRLRLAQSGRTSNVDFSGGVRYFNDPSDAALMFSASIPLGSRSRAKHDIEEKQYLSQREPYRYEQQRLALYSSLFEIYQELLHARTAFEALNQRIIPQAKQVATDYEQGYQSGRFSLLELNQAQQILLDVRLEEIIAAANFHRFRIEIERLTGTELSTKVSP